MKLFNNNLKKLREILKNQKIDFFLLPNSDEFFSEYLPESKKRIQFLSGFSGSNAFLIIGQKKCYFFTDGRYTTQAKNQLDSGEYEIFNIAEESIFSWLEENLKKSQNVVIDANIFSVNFVKKLQELAEKKLAKLEISKENLLDEIWVEKPKNPDSKIYFHDLKFSGLDSLKKRQIITENLKEDALFLNCPASICWLLNIRASDVEYTPILLASAILYKNNEVDLFVDEERISAKDHKKLQMVNFINGPRDKHGVTTTDWYFKLLPSYLSLSPRRMTGSMQIDPNTLNYSIYKSLQNSGFELVEKTNPCLILKSIKNKTEIEGAIKAHEIDGLALTKFLFWLEDYAKVNHSFNLLNTIVSFIKKVVGLGARTIIDELQAEKKLLEFRSQQKEFIYPSFASISAFASNGAIIHYKANEETNKKIKGNSLYLIDSGAQYFYGTTDVTRTVAVGKPSKEHIENFTRVLKGHVNLAITKFPKGLTGAHLDVLARRFLWQDCKDYDHGTGHGVGSFLSVHEGPISISKRSNQEFIENMVLSNEPGYYQEGDYGIRIENLIFVKRHKGNFLCFETLTLAPLDHRLIDFKMLTYPERKWLYEYHKEIFDKLKKGLNDDEREWLKDIVEIYSKVLVNKKQ